jgi:two-component system NtrC family response regulator
LAEHGYDVGAAADASEALVLLEKQPFELVLTDLNLPGISGLELLKRIRNDYPETSVVMVTAYGTIETAVAAIKAGAYDYIAKPVHPDELRALVNRVLERHRLIEEVHVLRSNAVQKYGFDQIIGESDALLQMLDSASRVAGSDATVLILGETGTGKELVAKAIHFNSLRRERPFVTINCGAIPGDLLESELFGHVKGSFTGATSHKKGKVEMADGGSVFLDEIGEMPLDLQVRVLRLLQEREIEKIGSTKPVRVDVRIIAATHRNLETLAAAGKFREDLYYRLMVIPIVVPPLRDRAGDVPELVHYFFERSKAKYKLPDLRLSPSVLLSLTTHKWPGNVRELENLIERLVVMSRSNEIGVTDLPASIWQGNGIPEGRKLPSIETRGSEGLEAVERELIVQTLREFNWNKTRAARQLRISRKTLLYRISKYNIVREISSRAPEGEQKLNAAGCG